MTGTDGHVHLPVAIAPGTNVTITGSGTPGDPWVINAAGGGGTTVINEGDRITITGTGTPGDPYVINADQTIVTAGPGITVTGTGTAADPYVVSQDPQPFGQAELQFLNSPIGTAAQQTWVDAPDTVNGGPALEIVLPEAGTYQIGGAIRGIVARDQTALVGSISLSARLFDVTAGVPVPLSARLVVSLDTGAPSDNAPNVESTVPMSLQYTVAGPTTLRLQGLWFGEIDPITVTTVSFRSYPDTAVNPGRTILNFHKIA